MGLFSDLLANAKTFSPSSRVAQKLATYRDTIDPALPTGFGAADAVHTIAPFAETLVAPATYTLTFYPPAGATPLVTPPIAFDDTADDVQAIVDTLMDGEVTGYMAGDIQVNDEDDDDAALSTDTFTITFAGDSVTSQSWLQTVITLDANPFAATPVVETQAGIVSTQDEIQTIPAFTNVPTGGTFDLTFNIAAESPFTIVVPFDATADEVQVLINTAATAAGITSWSDDDIVVNDEDDDDAGLLTDDLTITFSGSSVTQTDQGLCTVDYTNLTLVAGLDDPAYAVDTNGQQARNGFGALKVLGVLDGAAPPIEGGGESVTLTSNLGHVPQWVIREIAQEIAFQEQDKAIYDAIEAVIPDNDSPLLVG